MKIRQERLSQENPTDPQTPASAHAAHCHILRISMANLSIDLLAMNYWSSFDVILMSLYERFQIK